MTAILKKSVFLHISKTGGSWVTQALDCNNKTLPKHCNIDEVVGIRPSFRDRIFFAFIRNPATWWQSRWSCNWNRRFFLSSLQKGSCNLNRLFPGHKTEGARQLLSHSSILNKQELNDFNVWAYRVLKKEPGWLSGHYQHYLGENYDAVQYIGKYERLESDLIDILKAIGEDFTIKKIEKVNKGKDLNRQWDISILKRLILHEKDFMRNFGYSTSLADYKHLC